MFLGENQWAKSGQQIILNGDIFAQRVGHVIFCFKVNKLVLMKPFEALHCARNMPTLNQQTRVSHFVPSKAVVVGCFEVTRVAGVRLFAGVGSHMKLQARLWGSWNRFKLHKTVIKSKRIYSLNDNFTSIILLGN